MHDRATASQDHSGERVPERPRPPVPAALGPAAILALQRTAGNAAVARMLSTAPGPRLQRVKFILGRHNQLDHQDQRAKAIALQNQVIRATKSLYVAMDLSGKGPYVAMRLPLDDCLCEARVTEERVPRDTDFVDLWPVRFQTDFFTFEIDLVSDDIDPAFGKSDAEVKQAVEARLSGPFTISRIAARGGGGAIGRTFGGKTYWDVNPSYHGLFDPVGSDPMELVDPMSFANQAIKEYGLKPEDRLSNAPNPKALTQLPGASTQPFLLFTDLSGPGTAPTTARKDVDRDRFERKLTEGMELEQPGWMQQTGISKPPSQNRKDGGRDPNTEMGVSAWEPVGGHTAPMKGKLASHEWCHLVGDADSGTCAPQNLYIGTNHVNTEQLAMETALHKHRFAYAQRGWDIQIKASATVEEAVYQGMSYLKAESVSYEISLVKKGQPKILIHEQMMDGQRGIITNTEFKALEFRVDSRLEQGHKTVDEVEAFKPAPFNWK